MLELGSEVAVFLVVAADELGGRLDRDGAEVEPLDLDAVRAAVDAWRADGVQAIAVDVTSSTTAGASGWPVRKKTTSAPEEKYEPTTETRSPGSATKSGATDSGTGGMAFAPETTSA